MKTTFTLLIALLVATTSFAAPSIKAKKANGTWSASADWDLSRIPANSDSIIIPANMSVTINSNVILNNVIIRIFGTLKFTNGKLSVDNTSKIILETGGIIDGNGNNDQIRYDGSTIYKGTDGNLAGPMVASSGTGGFAPMSILPVSFLSFSARRETAAVVLNWATDKEFNNNHFVVERSIDGSNWKQIGIVLPATTSGVHQYEFKDMAQHSAVISYRIRQVDVDGSSSFSKIQTIRTLEAAAQAQVFASSKNTITVQFATPVKTNTHVKIFNTNGQVLQQVSAAPQTSKMQISLNSGSGAYVVQLVDGNGSIESKKLVL